MLIVKGGLYADDGAEVLNDHTLFINAETAGGNSLTYGMVRVRHLKNYSGCTGTAGAAALP
jgi:hypothetical protein